MSQNRLKTQIEMWGTYTTNKNILPRNLIIMTLLLPICLYVYQVQKGGVHKLRLQDLSFFDHLPPLCLHFLWYKCLQKVDFFDHLLPSSCKRSLWTAPALYYLNFLRHSILKWYISYATATNFSPFVTFQQENFRIEMFL